MTVAVNSKQSGAPLDDLQRLLNAKQALTAEVQALREERDRLGRFKEIDAEEEKLAGLRKAAETILEAARTEADTVKARTIEEATNLRDEVNRYAAATTADATKQGDAIIAEAKVQAERVADTLRQEGEKYRQAGQREKEAGRIELEKARKECGVIQNETTELAKEVAGRLRTVDEREVAILKREREFAARVANAIRVLSDV